MRDWDLLNKFTTKKFLVDKLYALIVYTDTEGMLIHYKTLDWYNNQASGGPGVDCLYCPYACGAFYKNHHYLWSFEDITSTNDFYQ